MLARAFRFGFALLVLWSAAACSETTPSALAVTSEAALAADRYLTADGMLLPLRVWRPAGPVRAVIVAAHGMNDYSLAWARPAARWSDLGIVTYAYDQRGFGGGAQRGQWAGAEVMAADLSMLARLAGRRHPGVPVYLMGESMGGAVAILAATRADAPPLAGVILSAPAVWPDSLRGELLRQVAWAGRLFLPNVTVPPRRARFPSSDDPAVIEQLMHDPMIIHDTRLETLAGVVDLMETARRRAPEIRQPVLLLFGDDDRQVYRDGVAELAAKLPAATVALYPGGRHLLFRSLHSQPPTDDVSSWVLRSSRFLPSEAMVRGQRCRSQIVAPRACPPPTELAGSLTPTTSAQ